MSGPLIPLGTDAAACVDGVCAIPDAAPKQVPASVRTSIPASIPASPDARHEPGRGERRGAEQP